jgi:hypothetical protein
VIICEGLMKRTFNKLIRGEKGQALLIVLVLMLVGGLIIAPLLSHIGTGLKTGKEVYEEKMYRLYAADAGIEDALWQVKNEKLPSSYNPYDYSGEYDYSLSSKVNDKDVNITIKNDWMPKDITAPDAGTAKQIIEQGKLLIVGGLSGTSATQYQIKLIYYYGGSDSTGANLKVQNIGIWLPPGFHYNNSCNLTGVTVANPPYKSGEAVVWTFSSPPKFKDLPSIGGTFTLPDSGDAFTITGGPLADNGKITKTAGSISVTAAGGATYNASTGAWTTPAGSGTVRVSANANNTVVAWTSTTASATAAITSDTDGDATTGYPMLRSFTFQFTGAAGQRPGAALSWINTQGVSDLVPGSSNIGYTWDADKKVYKIVSTAAETTDATKKVEVEAYAAKIEMRELGSAISGDYVAIGGTLMEATGTGDDAKYRDRLYMGSSATVVSGTGAGQIPTSATVEAAYLYWSGWIDHHYAEQYYSSGRWRWRWGEIPALNYDNYSSNLTTLVETNAMVNTVKFGGGGAMTNITTHQWQVMENVDQPGTWSYSCFCDLTKVVVPSTGKSVIDTLIDGGNINPNGSGTYTLQHADAVVNKSRTGYDTYYFDLYNTGQKTGYPLGTPATKLPGGSYSGTPYEWAYAGWSLIIIYSSPETKGRQLYLYDDFVYSGMNQNAPLPNGGTISGFLAPGDITSGGQYAAHLTCFVGEGDDVYAGDYISLNGTKLWDSTTSNGNSQSNPNNVWNSKSFPALNASGVDVDTFTVNYPMIKPGDTSAQVVMYTQTDSWNLVYMILSFRSSITTGGTMSYLVRG